MNQTLQLSSGIGLESEGISLSNFFELIHSEKETKGIEIQSARICCGITRPLKEPKDKKPPVQF